MLFSRFEASFLEVHEAFYSMVSIQHLHGNHQKRDPNIRFPFWSDVCRWLCRKCGPKPWFRLQGNHQKLERNLTFLEDSDATFWHRRWGKSGSKMAFVSRPGHAVFPFWGLVSWGPRGFLVWFLQHWHGYHPKCDIRFSSFWSDVRRWLCRKCGPKPWFRLQGNNQKLERNLIFFRGFRRNVLTSEVGEKWFENGLREPARRCCFPVLRPRFLRSTRLSSMVSIQHLYGNHQKCDPDIRFRPFWSDVCRWLCRKCGPNPWFRLRLQGNHQKLERNLTFFKGFRRNVLTPEVHGGKVVGKWPSWAGQAPVLKGFFSRSQRSSMSTTSTSLPKPALSYQNLIVF